VRWNGSRKEELVSGYWEKEGDTRANDYRYTVIGLGASHAGLRNGSFDKYLKNLATRVVVFEFTCGHADAGLHAQFEPLGPVSVPKLAIDESLHDTCKERVLEAAFCYGSCGILELAIRTRGLIACL